MVLADSIDAVVTIEPRTVMTLSIVLAGMVVGTTVVPATVVVQVLTPPKAVTGIALPTPAAVYGVGIGRVAVLGAVDDPYILPVIPFFAV